ncbi:AAA family ATPase, partial [Candidatus Micrarchaeota archaeon]|nr:AAA family ATPase [Candidatus Micrarchaeota archaeon]
MIQIKKLTLKNFKSFKKAEIPIARGFTAIVGSNGSGKSNILDALLFVLGISSLKALRASRMTDLVNNQTNENYAKVELELEDKEKQKKWMISRTVDKQGRAIVRLDDKRVALNEVTGLLEELGITATGHNIVVQGDITRIMEMNAIQRREMIDEVAGIREFDTKRTESFKELDKVDQKIKEVRIVLSERETYLEELSKEREAALEFNRMAEEIQKTKATLFKAEIQEIEEKMKKNASKKEQLDQDLQEKNTKFEEDRTELEKLEEKIEEANQQIISASEKTYSGIGILVEEKKSEKKVREERKNALQEIIQKNKEKITVLKERNEAIEKELVQKNALLSEKEKEIKQLEKDFSAEQKIVEEKRSQWKQKSQDLKGLEARLREEEEKIDEKRILFFGKQSFVQSTQKTIELKKQALLELQSEKKRLNERIVEKKKKKELLNGLLQKNPAPEASLDKLEKKLGENSQKQAYAESRLDSIKEAIRLLEKSIANCPTCDSKLSDSGKQRVLNLKKNALSEESREYQSFQSQKKELTEQKERLELVLNKKRELEFSLANFEELNRKNSELEQKIQQSQREIEEIPLVSLQSELKSIEKELRETEGMVKENENAVIAFKKEHDFESFTRTSQKMEQLSKKLNEQKGARKELELETSLVLTEETKSNNKNAGLLEQENQELNQKSEGEEQ